ncbi:MAG: ATP-binding cassette domain-containing protein [Nitrospirae bacterium]|nr:ATP-binding cassette domain-containing protein [Nitrospirota bacterium]
MTNNIFELSKASIILSDKPILHEISLTIAHGQHTAIIGPNGSGKTTLMKLLTGDTHAVYKDDGSFVKLFGQTRYSIWDIKRLMGIITNDLDEKHKSQASHMSGIEIILTGIFDTIGFLPQEKITLKLIDKAESLMNKLGIQSLRDHAFRDMSSGETRKCLIARALISEPVVLMLDEPTTGLDIAAQLRFFELMERVSVDHTIIIITHHIEEVLSFINNIVMINDGRIFTQGPKKVVLTNQNVSELFSIPLEVFMESNGTYHFLMDSKGGSQTRFKNPFAGILRGGAP